MTEFNSCADLTNKPEFKAAALKYDELLESGTDPFEYMLQMQKDLQVALSTKGTHNPNPNDLRTIGQKFDWLRENKQALDDEYREMIDALPGMETPAKDRSAVWKRWKTKYDEIRAKTFDDLSQDELKELKFELIDMLHFVYNMTFALNINARDIFIFYYTKNAENVRRCRNGY